jgi:four helix bundle protein
MESESKGKQRVESWRDLEVWKIAHNLVLKVYEATKSFPNDERYRLTDQICRAATSVPTNIAEGKGRNSLKEYLQFLSIARGSVEEVKYLLLLAKDLGYIPEQTYLEMANQYDQAARMLNGLMKSLRLRT